MADIVTITGPSCSGKDELSKALQRTGRFTTLVSVTTREPRDGEVDGDSYYFVSKETFQEYISKGALVEYEIYGEHGYGVLVDELVAALANDKTPVVIVEPNGSRRWQLYGQKHGLGVVTVFLNAPAKTLLARWLSRLLAEPAESMNDNVISRAADRILLTLFKEVQWAAEMDFDIKLDSEKNSPEHLAYYVERLLGLDSDAISRIAG